MADVETATYAYCCTKSFKNRVYPKFASIYNAEFDVQNLGLVKNKGYLS